MRTALALAAAMIAGSALAADEPVSTAPPTPAPMTAAEQIDAFIRSSPVVTLDAPGYVGGLVAGDDRKIHGVVEVGVGAGGYRSVYVRTDVPVGEAGRVSLAFEDSRGRHGLYPHHAYRGGLRGPFDRQRCDLEEMSAPRPLDVLGGPHGHCVSR